MARRVSASGNCNSAVRAHLETRSESLFEVGDFRGRRIAGEDDLLAAVAKRVEGVEEFLLRAVLAGEELDVINQEHIDLPVAFAEFLEFAVLDGADVVVGELFGGDVENLQVLFVLLDEMADGLHQVGLAEPHAAVQKQRIVRAGRSLRHRARRRRCKPVVLAHDKRIERAARIEARPRESAEAGTEGGQPDRLPS